MIIKEFQYLQYRDEDKENYIKPESFEALEKFVLDNEETAQYLKITTKKGFGKVLQAQNYVGVIQTKDGTIIEILPKIQNVDENKSKEILIKMLKTLKKSPFKNFNMANLKSSKMPLLEIFISMFLEELSKLIKKGIKSDYISKEENLRFLKGKLKISEQIKYNTIHKERFFVQYEEFMSDRIENRLIKTTLQYLYKKSKLNKNQQRIREFLFVFDEMGISHNIKTDFSNLKLNRQMKDYEQVLLWCKTFLLENSFSPYKGNDVAFALLFDMNLLFESYVYDYLKRNGNFDDITAQDKEHHLAYLDGKISKFQLKPDIVINKGEIIADTKWKLLSEDKTHQGISQSDMYQLYAYGTKYKDCKYMYLIYPYDGLDIQNSYQYFRNDEEKKLKDELHLNVLFFDVCENKHCFKNEIHKNEEKYEIFKYSQT
ncbi:type IV methyl-directed restriction system, component McrC [Arcobacter acticola]|uniref:Type IV methyl-directed restriction system, component McrC n=1 Tax=Arcobacter acticola TaxID=1849015 RepID=A0A6M8EZI1_9BACT|nr:McrC family protein [Arcobacter acticola]QKE29977.1 type IV methyl-directed restriction system, component McrC [Arcobacter acticola]